MDKKKKKLRPLSQKLRVFRSQDPLLQVLMWGIDHCCREIRKVPEPPFLLPDAFKAYTKVKVDNKDFMQEVMPQSYKVKQYAPLVFRALRKLFNLSEASYSRSLRFEPSELQSASRSGSRFFESADGRLFIKTIFADELDQIHSMIKHYYEYVVQQKAETLLPQFFGIYRLTVNTDETYVVVMRNSFMKEFPVIEKYDLKGSTVDRLVTDKEAKKMQKQNDSILTLKDCNFLSNNRRIFIGQYRKQKLIDTLRHDTDFLANNKLMDYSLLVGIHDPSRVTLTSGQGDQLDDEDNVFNQSQGELLESGEVSRPESTERKKRSSSYGNQDGQPIPSTTPTGGPLPDVGDYGPNSYEEEYLMSSDNDDTTKPPWKDLTCVPAFLSQSQTAAAAASGEGTQAAASTSTSQTADKNETPSGVVVTGGDRGGPPDASDGGAAASNNNNNSSPPVSRGATLGLSGDHHHYDASGAPITADSIPPAPGSVYFFTLVDVLTNFGVKKLMAHNVKAIKHGSNVDGISTVAPEKYAERFLTFIDKVTE